MDLKIIMNTFITIMTIFMVMVLVSTSLVHCTFNVYTNNIFVLHAPSKWKNVSIKKNLWFFYEVLGTKYV